MSDKEKYQIHFRNTKMVVMVSKDDSEGRYSLIEMVHPPNIGPALHIHPNAPEAYYVLEGEYVIQCGDKINHSKAGDFVFIPKAVPHSYKSGQSGGKMLVISPAGLENYFKKVANAVRTGKITWELEKEIASQYGQQFLDSLNHWGQ
jgi:mannose-6-phosphate isomerase-like protein (cupin superfamily)